MPIRYREALSLYLVQHLCCIFHGTFLFRAVGSSDPEAAHNGTHSIDVPMYPTHPMLQLISLSPDSWGSMHVEAEQVLPCDTPQSLRKSAAHKTSRPPMLSLMSLNLDTWGYNDTSSSSPLGVIVSTRVDYAANKLGNPLAQVLVQDHNLFDARGLETHSVSFILESAQGGSAHLLVVLFILLLLSAMLFCLCHEVSSDYDGEADMPCSPTSEIKQDFVAVENTDGSWAQVYREARGEQKEALELLFRCNIISTDEFAFSSVSPEHIQECVWIATHMLQQKPLEEWVALWQQAQQTFEDSVAACFEARGGPYSNTSLPTPPSSAMALPRLNFGGAPISGAPIGGAPFGSPPSSQRLAQRLSSTLVESEESSDPYTTRSHYREVPRDMQQELGHRDPSFNISGSEGTHWSIDSDSVVNHGSSARAQ